MRAKEEVLGKYANDHVAGEMTKILDLALQQWSNRVRTRLAGAIQGPAGNGASGQGQPGNSAGGPGQASNGVLPAGVGQATSSFILPDSDNL
jgi:hypothetical protein